MNQRESSRGEDTTLFDLWQKLRGGWRTLLVSVAVGIAGAVMAILLISPRFEAVAVLQVGQVGQVGHVGQVGPLAGLLKVTGQPVEAPVQAVERIKTPAFQRRVAESLGDQGWLKAISRSASGVTRDVAAQLIKATAAAEQGPLIELRANGTTPEGARRKAETVLEQLASAHAELASPVLVRMRSDLAINRERLASAERDVDNLSKLLATASVRDDRFTQLSLMTSLQIEKETEAASRREMIVAMETALEAPATQPARSIEPIFVSDRALSPKIGLVLALGAVGGLMFGMSWIFAADAWRRASHRRSA